LMSTFPALAAIRDSSGGLSSGSSFNPFLSGSPKIEVNPLGAGRCALSQFMTTKERR